MPNETLNRRTLTKMGAAIGAAAVPVSVAQAAPAMPDTVILEKARAELAAQAQVYKEQAEEAALAMVRNIDEPLEMTLSNTYTTQPGYTMVRFTTEAPDGSGVNTLGYGPNQMDLSILVPSESLRGRVAGDKVTLTINWA